MLYSNLVGFWKYGYCLTATKPGVFLQEHELLYQKSASKYAIITLPTSIKHLSCDADKRAPFNLKGRYYQHKFDLFPLRYSYETKNILGFINLQLNVTNKACHF